MSSATSHNDDDDHHLDAAELKPDELLIKLIALGLEPSDFDGVFSSEARDFVGVVIGHGRKNSTQNGEHTAGAKEQEHTQRRSSSYSMITRDRPPVFKRTSSGRHAPNWDSPAWSQPMFGKHSQEQETKPDWLSNGDFTYTLVERNGPPVFKRTASGRHAANWGMPTWSTGNSFDQGTATTNGSVDGERGSRTEDIFVRRMRPSNIKRTSSGRHAPNWGAPAWSSGNKGSLDAYGKGEADSVNGDHDDDNKGEILVKRARPSAIKRISSGRHAPQWSGPSFDNRSVTSPASFSSPSVKEEQEQDSVASGYRMVDRDGSPVFQRVVKSILSRTPSNLASGDSTLSIPKKRAGDDDGAHKLVSRSGTPVFKRVSSGRSAPQWSAPAFAQQPDATVPEEAKEKAKEEFTYRLVDRPDGPPVFKRVPTIASSTAEEAPTSASEQAAEVPKFTYRLVDRPNGPPVFQRVPLEKSPSVEAGSAGKEPTALAAESPTYRLVERAEGAPVFKRVSSGRHAPQWSAPSFSPAATPASNGSEPDQQRASYRLVSRASGGGPVFKRVSSGRQAPQWSTPSFPSTPTPSPASIPSKQTESGERFTYRLLEHADGTPVFKRVSFIDPPVTATAQIEPEGFTYRLVERGEAAPVFSRVVKSGAPASAPSVPKVRRQEGATATGLDLGDMVKGTIAGAEELRRAVRTGRTIVKLERAVALPKGSRPEDVLPQALASAERVLYFSASQ